MQMTASITKKPRRRLASWFALFAFASGVAVAFDASKAAEIIELSGHRLQVYALAFSPNSARLLSGADDPNARLWDVSAGRTEFELQGHTGEVTYVAFTPDTKRALSAAKDKTVRLWDLETGKELRSWTDRGPETALSPDGRRAVSIVSEGTNGTGLLVWEVEIVKPWLDSLPVVVVVAFVIDCVI